MNRMRVASVHKILQISVLAALVFCTPLQLTAQEREPRAAEQATTIEWLTRLWTDLTAWLADEVPASSDQPTESVDDACSIDPWGRCPGHSS